MDLMMKTVLITGASSGIGEATAEYFLRRGWRVCATARSPELLGSWSRRSEVIPVTLDVTKQESIHQAIADAVRLAGKIDVLVNNAGVGLAGPLEAIPVNEIEQHFQTKLLRHRPNDSGDFASLPQTKAWHHRERLVCRWHIRDPLHVTILRWKIRRRRLERIALL